MVFAMTPWFGVLVAMLCGWIWHFPQACAELDRSMHDLVELMWLTSLEFVCGVHCQCLRCMDILICHEMPFGWKLRLGDFTLLTWLDHGILAFRSICSYGVRHHV